MSITQIFQRAAGRRFVLVVSALLLGWLGLGRANAQSFEGCFTNSGIEYLCVNRDDAYRASKNAAIWLLTVGNNREHGEDVGWRGYSCDATKCRIIYEANSPQGHSAEATRSWLIGSECPTGQSWNDGTQSCVCAPGTTQALDGTCKACDALNSEPGSIAQAGSVVRPWSERCVGGCKLAWQPGPSSFCVTVGSGATTTSCTGTFAYTGASCPVTPDQPKPEPVDPKDEPSEECMPADASQTFCLRKDGRHCYTSSGGKQTCWSPGETGQKGNENEMQRREPGQEASPPNPATTKEGDAYQPNGDPITTTTTKGNGVSITTTVSNYTTQNGTNADNQVGTGGAGGDAEEDGDGSTGGGDCGAPPASSGDALLAQIAHQAWATRCAIEDRNKAQDDEASELAGQGDGLDGVSEGSIFKTFEAGDLNENLLGTSGGMCSFGVPLELMGQPIELPPEFWSLASWIGMLVVASAYLWVAHKLGG